MIRFSTILFVIAAALGLAVLNMTCESARMSPEEVNEPQLILLAVLWSAVLGIAMKLRHDND